MPALLTGLDEKNLDETARNRVFDLVLAICRRSAYLVLLVQHPKALDRMLDLFARSEWVAEKVIRFPALLDELIDPSLGAQIPSAAQLDQSVERILDATAALLAEMPVDKITTAAIADKAGVPIGSVYQYFPNKLAVLAQLARRVMEEVDLKTASLIAEDFGVLPWDQAIDRAIDAAVASLERTTGVRPQGWYCRYGPGLNTRRLVVEHGAKKSLASFPHAGKQQHLGAVRSVGHEPGHTVQIGRLALQSLVGQVPYEHHRRHTHPVRTHEQQPACEPGAGQAKPLGRQRLLAAALQSRSRSTGRDARAGQADGAGAGREGPDERTTCLAG